MNWNIVRESSHTLSTMPDRIQREAENLRFKHASDSIAAAELDESIHPASLEAANARGTRLYLFIAMDHMRALKRLLAPSSVRSSLTPWTCGRVILESCAKSIWLLDPEVEVKERLTRSLNIRLDDLFEWRKYVRSISAKHSQRPKDAQAAFSQADERIKLFRRRAQDFGIVEKLNKRGRFIGFGNGIQSTLDIICLTLGPDLEGEYRLLSSAIHGSNWATLTLGATTSESQSGSIASLHLEPSHAMALVMLSLQSFALSSWSHFNLYGWNAGPLSDILETEYDQAKFNQKSRFWRSDYPRAR